MTRSRAKGTAFETSVVDFLRSAGHRYVERRAMRSSRDCGDLAGLPGWVCELKNHREMDWGNWCNEAAREAVNAGVYRWAVIAKRRGKNVRDAYVVIPLWCFAELLTDDESLPADVVLNPQPRQVTHRGVAHLERVEDSA